MSTIFARACLIIVGATGESADAGFKGLKDISQSRRADQKEAMISDHQCLIKPSSNHLWRDTTLQSWSIRAWTFQEAMCSRRLLFFAHDSVRWRCRKSRWSEESTADDCVEAYSMFGQDKPEKPLPTLSGNRLPVLNELETLVNTYNVRNLTYNEDSLAAFSGVAIKLSARFEGGLISGLPELFFDICLLWRPSRRVDRVERRRPNMTDDQVSLPSWSWAG